MEGILKSEQSGLHHANGAMIVIAAFAEPAVFRTPLPG